MKDTWLVLRMNRFKGQSGDYGSVEAIQLTGLKSEFGWGPQSMKISTGDSSLNPKLEYLASTHVVHGQFMPFLCELDMVNKVSGGKPVSVLIGIDPCKDSAQDLCSDFFTSIFNDLPGLRKRYRIGGTAEVKELKTGTNG